MSPQSSPPTLVLGAGIAGLATAWHVARSGARVHVVDPAPRAFASASGANAAILRTVVEDAATAELAARGAHALAQPDAELAERPFVDPVGVILTADDEDAVARLARNAALCRTPLEELDPARLDRIAPHVATRPLVAYWAASDGVVDLAHLASALTAAIERRGGRIQLGVGVRDWLGADGEVSGAVLTDDSRVEAEAVVVAAGGWAAALGMRAGSAVALTPRRRHAAKLTASAPIDPRWPVVWNDGDAFYSRPYDGGLLVCNCDASAVEPDQCEVDEDAVDRLRTATARHLRPPYDDAPLAAWCAMRTFAPDKRFVLGPDPDVRGMFWAAGFGGHGITCGLAAGELVACAIAGGADALRAVHAPSRAGARATA